MKKVTIDLTNIHTPRAAHVYMGFVLGFPAHYGRNIDALHDLLGEISEPTQLIIRRPADLPPEMAAYFPRLALMLHDAQAENESLEVFAEIV